MPLLHLLRQNPVIAAVKDNASLQLAIDSECQFISVLYGNICTISNIVKKIKGRCEQVPDMRSCLSSGAIEQGSS